MKINKFALIWSCCIILSGCTMTLSQKEEASTQEESKVIKSEPAESGTIQNKQEQIGITHARLIDEQIASSIGESKSYFDNKGDSKVKIYILNTGTESFQFSIRNVNDKKKIVTGVLNTNETYEDVLNDLPEGSYLCGCRRKSSFRYCFISEGRFSWIRVGVTDGTEETNVKADYRDYLGAIQVGYSDFAMDENIIQVVTK